MKAHADPHLHTHVHTDSPTDEHPHPIPASVTIVNDQTPLLHSHPAANRSLHHRRSRSSLTLSHDPDTRWKEIGGLALMALSALAFSFMALFVKVAGVLLPSLEIVLARSVVQLVFGLAACAILGLNPLGAKDLRGWLVLRGLAGSVGLALFFYSLTLLPLVEATVLFFLGPTITIFLAHFLDSTPLRSSDTLFTILSLLGVALLARPQLVGAKPRAPEDAWPLAAALLGAFMSAGAYVTARKVGRAVHFMVHVVYFGAVSSVLSVVALYAWQGGWVKPDGRQWVWLAVVGGCAFGGQCLLNAGLHLAPPGPSTLLRPADVLLALFLGVTILDEIPSGTTLTGSLLVTCAATIMGITRTSPPAPKLANMARERETRRILNKQVSGETLTSPESRTVKRQGSMVSVLSMPPEPEERRKRRKERRERERREKEANGESSGTSEGGSTEGSEPGSELGSEPGSPTENPTEPKEHT